MSSTTSPMPFSKVVSLSSDEGPNATEILSEALIVPADSLRDERTPHSHRDATPAAELPQPSAAELPQDLDTPSPQELLHTVHTNHDPQITERKKGGCLSKKVKVRCRDARENPEPADVWEDAATKVQK